MWAPAVFLLTLFFSVNALPQFSKFVVMIFENHGYQSVISNPYWSQITSESFSLTSYYQIVKGSQPNYVAMLAGNTFDCLSENVCYLSYPTLMDLLEKKGLTWKSYNEGYQPASNGDCSMSASGLYSRNHNPFLAFTSITGSYERCLKVVNANQFYQDLVSNSLPDFSYYVPDNYNNSHDKDLYFSGSYLTNFLNTWYYPYLTTTWKDTLLMITWDEDSKDGVDVYHISALFKHPCLPAGGSNNDTFDHYSVPLFVEQNFGLDSLGQMDAKASNFANVFPSSCSSGGGTGSHVDGPTSADGMLQNLHQITRDNNILIMILLSLSFVVLPLVRLAWTRYRHFESDLKQSVQPTWKTPLIQESNFYYAYANLPSNVTAKASSIPLATRDPYRRMYVV